MLSRICAGIWTARISARTLALRTKIHTWQHGPALYRLRDVEFTPNQALTTLAVAVGKLEERDQ